uniref:Uncharacterized protein n=1 Tax=Panagrolaimus sp. JU765 TaxID=591449 RepID=A0AC34RNZ2_9BILA
MGNIFSKDGMGTKIIEALPGGGYFTAIFHAAAGNAVHAVQAAIAGFGTLAALTLGPVASAIAAAGTASLSAIFDQMGLSDDKKQEAIIAAENGKYDRAEILIKAGSEKVAENSRQLSTKSGELRCFKSVHGTYLRAYDRKWKVGMVPDWGGKVVFKAIHLRRFLSAHEDGHVVLVDRSQAWETWSPFKNEDGSWSFLSVHNRWLSASEDGSVTTVEKCAASEHFWVE